VEAGINMRFLFFRPREQRTQGWQFRRAEYKAQWNAISGSDGEAKMAVTGIVDDAVIAESARNSRLMLERYVDVRTSDVILEIGAGFGRVGKELAPICRQWIGTDVSENMVAHIQRRLAHFPNVRAVATSGFDLEPIPSGTVDLVYCIVVFPHLDEWERYNYIREGLRVLQPRGRMLVDNVNLASNAGWKIFETSLSFAPHERPSNISRCSTPAELAIYFDRAGFVDVRQAEEGDTVFTYGIKPAV
jgi:ubiquinone/menaquinone biosynthesis C-methylase UbiE